MALHNELGKLGEQIAQNYVQKLGYQIIQTNWLHKKFEIDIIALDNDEIVFIEVKTRTNDVFGQPEEALTLAKQKQLIDAADFYLNENELDAESRFDLITVVNPTGSSIIKHYKNIFRSEF